MSVNVHVPSQAGRPAIESRPVRLGGLFPPSQAGRLRPRTVALAGVALLAGAAVSLLRTTGTGPLQSIWEEDARDILDGALNSGGWDALWRPVAGYFVLVPRLLGELATLFPLSWAAAVLSISSALITAGLVLVVYSASAAFFPTKVLGQVARIAVSAPILAAPVAENRFTEIYNRPVCLHFFAVYAVFWVLLWTPATLRGRIAAGVTVALTGLSTILIVAWLPLAALRLAVRRDRWSVTLASLVAGGSAVQLLGLWTGIASRSGISVTRLDPLWVVRTFAEWGLPSAVLGFRGTSGLSAGPDGGAAGLNRGVISLAWLIVLAVVLAAIIGGREGWLRPQWSLGTAAGVGAVWVYGLTAVANGAITYRYLVPVELLLFAAAVALLWPATQAANGLRVITPAVIGAKEQPRSARTRAVVSASALALVLLGGLAAIAFNYRWTDTYRAHAPLWTDQVRLADAACQANHALTEVIVRGGPQPWWSIVRVPCHDFRPPPLVCSAPSCEWLDPPVSIGPARGRYAG